MDWPTVVVSIVVSVTVTLVWLGIASLYRRHR